MYQIYLEDGRCSLVSVVLLGPILVYPAFIFGFVGLRKKGSTVVSIFGLGLVDLVLM